MFKKKEEEKKEPATFHAQSTQREWDKAKTESRMSMVSSVINNDEDHGLWERFADDRDGWDRILGKLRPHVTNERAPDDIPT